MIKIVFRFIHDKIFGWKLASKPPSVKKAILIAYPHTTYYDGFYLLFASVFLNLYLIFKAEGWILYLSQLFGHLSVKRNSSLNQTDQIAEFIKNNDEARVVLSPEGTTHYCDYIKSGFYYIAKKADVPIICCCYNYKKGEYYFSHPMNLKEKNGEYKKIETVMEEIKYYYKINRFINVGKYPNNEGVLKLKNE